MGGVESVLVDNDRDVVRINDREWYDEEKERMKKKEGWRRRNEGIVVKIISEAKGKEVNEQLENFAMKSLGT